jgi:PASTA domain-containing protein
MGGGIEAEKSQRDERSEQPSIAKFFLSRRVLLGVVIVLLAAGVLLATSRSTTSATVPNLVGERVDPQLDGLRLWLAAAGLVLRNVATAPCPTVDLPGASLEELPGTIIDQYPAAGKEIEPSGAVDVTVCLPV